MTSTAPALSERIALNLVQGGVTPDDLTKAEARAGLVELRARVIAGAVVFGPLVLLLAGVSAR